jgi:hypothetical protein
MSEGCHRPSRRAVCKVRVHRSKPIEAQGHVIESSAIGSNETNQHIIDEYITIPEIKAVRARRQPL